MITSSDDVDTLKEAFDFALKLNLTFKGLLIAKAWEESSKCKGYGYYDYQCPSESRHIRIMPSNMLMIQKLLRMSTFFLRLLVLSMMH